MLGIGLLGPGETPVRLYCYSRITCYEIVYGMWCHPSCYKITNATSLLPFKLTIFMCVCMFNSTGPSCDCFTHSMTFWLSVWIVYQIGS